MHHGGAIDIEFTMRKTELRGGLGLQLHDAHAGALCIRHVCCKGAINSWNKICAGARPNVCRGDLIIKVNNVTSDTSRMLEECCNTYLVKFTVERESPLNAEAPAFVPGRPAWAGKTAKGSTLCEVCDSTKTIQERVETWLANYHLEHSGDHLV